MILTERRARMQAIQTQAGTAVGRAIRHGQLVRPASLACVDCGVQAEHYDHRDYTQPLKVEPTCRKCNFKRGSALVWAEDFHPGPPPKRAAKAAA